MNLQVTQLKIGKVEAAKIEWNGAEIKASLNKGLEDYRNAVVTQDSIPGFKKDMADMNKQAKEIDEFRKGTVKILNPDIKQFELETKELVTMIKTVRTFVSDQVQNFEEEERGRKREIARLLILQTRNEVELNEKYLPMIEIKDEYMLAAANPTKVKKLILENFKEVKALQDAEQAKIDTVHIILDAHNERLTFKFEFEYFERHINDETSLQELSAIVNTAVNKRLLDEQAELEKIKKAQEEAVAKAKFEAELKAKQEAARVKAEEEAKHQAELDRIEKEKKQAEWKLEFEREQAAERLAHEKAMAEQEAKEAADKVEADKQEAIRMVEAEKAEVARLAKVAADKAEFDRLEVIRIVEEEKAEALRVAEEAQAKVVEEAKAEAERLAPVVNNKQKVHTITLEIKANKNQMEALKAYMEEYGIEHIRL